MNTTPFPWRLADAGRSVVGPPKSDGSLPEVVAANMKRGDARLLRAAPDLLTVCRLMLDAWDNPTSMSESMQADAIAKMRAAVAALSR